MKGAIKTLKRAPQMLGSKMHLKHKSEDPEFDALASRFTKQEEYVSKLLKDVDSFYKNVERAVTSPAAFATAMEEVIKPQLTDDPAKYPEAKETRANLPSYIEESGEVERTVRPELDLIAARVLTPLKEYQDVMRHIRKVITKREHKLVDFDRHTNSYQKLQNKESRSAKEEKQLYTLEAEVEAATIEYDNYNSKLKQELPVFFDLTQSFITPLFETFYFAQAGILYTMLEHYHQWSTERYEDLAIDQVEPSYKAKVAPYAPRFEHLNITRRFISTQHLLSQFRNGQLYDTSGPAEAAASDADLQAADPAAPPAYADSKAPTHVTALYDFVAQAEGDLSFKAGDKIELVHRTDTVDDWWTGKVHGVQGIFPGNYVQ